jgi:hypothetical protein
MDFAVLKRSNFMPVWKQTFLSAFKGYLEPSQHQSRKDKSAVEFQFMFFFK